MFPRAELERHLNDTTAPLPAGPGDTSWDVIHARYWTAAGGMVAAMDQSRLVMAAEWNPLADDALAVARTIIEEASTGRCPGCAAGFVDWDGCYAIQCKTCQTWYPLPPQQED